MPSRINIGPGGGPFVELDEENGEFVIRVPEDEVNFDQSDLRNVKDFTAGSVNTDDLYTTDRDPDIVVKKDSSGTIKAIGDDSEGEIASGSDLTTILHAARDALTSNREWKEKILIKGDFELASPYEVTDYLITETRGRVTLADGADTDMIRNVDRTNGNNNISFIGGVWDGNKANNTTGESDRFIFALESCENVTYRNVTAQNAARDAWAPGLEGDGGSDHTWLGCLGRNNDEDAFSCLNMESAIFSGCIAKNNGGKGFHPSLNSEGVVIDGCVAHNNRKNFDIFSSQNVELRGCVGYASSEKNVVVRAPTDGVNKNIRISGLFVDSGDEAVHIAGSNTQADNITVDVTVIDAGASGIFLQNAPNATVKADVKDTQSSNIDIEDSDGVRLISPTAINETTAFSNKFQANIRMRAGSNDTRISDAVYRDEQNVADEEIVNDGDRTRWNGEIGGGPLGGVDIGSIDITAIREGVKAVSDGTTNAAGVTYRRFGGAWVDT